ncbi:glycosyltransferase family 4 protein [Pallidibacillus pasinlerensis]|uniref:Undecaprenyl/decaprenyl-phosphate alpha-N-acetylglucosaminyl 1-phosphate transferase n=1 Tax=Pallidibacillus pasinlerensis TaxID=2703818 RepID=A0ABX0A985_9BACI|nr:MraY family glycosyltransferase [Pallidibacillus pasinlerensis]NCU17692.1 undecaprenyl/decaprenyl-phosphate alpha-N-acetylglucosaminyl 1-phosphate transferase [Pallidibacillus pasinlerensis]
MEFIIIPILLCFVLSLLLTPIVKKFSIKIGAIDKPDERKVHKRIMPRMGGLAIIISFIIGCLVFIPNPLQIWPILAGAVIIGITGLLDDMYSLAPRTKLLGQIIAATIPVLFGVQIDFITLPNGEMIHFGWLAIPLTILWIVAIINAINLIDGLDGLAAGVSSIAVITISILALTLGHPLTVLMGIILLGSILGFLVFNFYPAKIFMGDTGSLFLGYMISVLSVIGLTKSAAIFSLIIPIIILAVPIMDTTFAIIRRIVQKKPLSAPDKFHLHHCLIRLGFTHRQSVIIIYLLSGIFSLAAILFTRATIWGASILIVLLLILVELIVEVTGLISVNYRPLLNLIGPKKNQDEK